MAADRDEFRGAEAVIIFAECKDGGIYKAFLLSGTYQHVPGGSVAGKELEPLQYQQNLLTSRNIPWAFLGDVLEDMSAYGVRIGA